MPSPPPSPNFFRFWFRTTACHMVTYSVVGILAYTLMNYRGLFTTPGLDQLMRPIDSPWVAAGPALQVFRGLLIAAVLYPFRAVFLESWWKLALLLVGLCVLSTSGPTPSSLEGLVYTRLSLAQHLRGLPEILLQNVAFAWMLVAWCRKPNRVWAIGMGVFTALVVLMSIAGVLVPRPETFR